MNCFWQMDWELVHRCLFISEDSELVGCLQTFDGCRKAFE